MKTINHGISRSDFLRTLACSLPLLPGAACLAQAPQNAAGDERKADLAHLRAFVELARADIRTEKSCILAENLPLTETEAQGFWPLQREYDAEFTKLLDERYAAIIRFSEHYGSMTDAEATKLAEKSFEIESKRTALKRKYFARFCKVLPALKAARFFQIENQINLLLDLKVAASLPLLK